MSYDFEYFSGGYLTTPVKPSKPTLGRNPSSIEARAFADELEDYERRFKGYEEDKRWYQSEQSRIHAEFKDKLKKDYGLSDAQFDVLYSQAYDRGHSGGLQEVYSYFDSLYDFAEQYMSVSKK